MYIARRHLEASCRLCCASDKGLIASGGIAKFGTVRSMLAELSHL